MAEEIDTKKHMQQFLKESIIDQGISPKRFEEFVYTLKDEPFDIDSWSPGELMKIVEMFKRFEKESKINELLVSTTLGQHSKIVSDNIEYIEVTR